MTSEELDELKEDVEAAEESAGAAEEELNEGSSAVEESDKAASELAAMKDQLLRTMAEYDNFRKRSAREKDALRAEIVTNVTSKFLPVLDNLERALQTECSDVNYKKGVEMISDSFLETLKGLGVEEIASDGAPFDPNLHQAVQRVDDSELESGTVVQTFAKGYKIGDRVIRFAMVSVAN
ncbi:MAG: nucleotide exchange factor GrpE [Oscillospiraceae bacterium]|nr:nucleotide exchange factor GrpE [Oscillospiraceae bacterium]